MKTVMVRSGASTWSMIEAIIYKNYPDNEFSTFFRCGWHETEDGLVVTIHSVIEPHEGDAKATERGVEILEPYTVRTALEVGVGEFSVGLIHSHPESFSAWPSCIDDEMDKYLSEYFTAMVGDRPYISLIVAREADGRYRFSGRVCFRGQWYQCKQLQIVGLRNTIIRSESFSLELPDEILARLERMTGIAGIESAKKLWGAKVAIIGGGGTGSAAFHSLVRSCVGEIVVIDPQVIATSNSERLHGIVTKDLKAKPPLKVNVLKRLAAKINPLVKVTAVPGDANAADMRSLIIGCDLILGCTDSQVGRVLVSELAVRYLLPAIHVTVAMESKSSRIVGQVVHITRYGPEIPCVHCRSQVDTAMLAQELMTEEERLARKQAAATAQPEQRNMYWTDEPVVHTVGSLTTVAAELAANYAKGLLTGAWDMPADFIELNILSPDLGTQTLPLRRRSKCLCISMMGGADQVEGWLGN